jgi:hypothetical protein
VLVAVMVLLAVYVVLCEPHLDLKFGSDTEAQTCDPALPDETQCKPDEWCMHEVCTPRDAVCEAQRGEQCQDCDCVVGLQCGADLRCHPQHEAPSAPTCDDPAVRAAIQRLTTACRARKRSVEEQAEGGCSADEWRKLLAENTEIGDLLAAFPDRFALYFPVNEPRRGKRWPGAAQPDIIRQFAAHSESLRGASAIFIIGRATPDGRPDEDTQLAVRRLNAVERMLDRVLHGNKKPSQRTGGPMLASWGARGDRSIPLDKFIHHFAGTHAPIAVSTAESQRLADAMANASELSQSQRDALERSLNRVALVIPIHCPLVEARG